MHGSDAWVFEPRENPGLAPQSLRQCAGLVGNVQYLERDAAAKRGILRKKHRAHPAASDFAHQSVPRFG